jgi:hypothetical protein
MSDHKYHSEKEAKEYLKNRQRQPWDEPLADHPVESPKPAQAAPEKEKPRPWLDEVDNQYNRLKTRNEEIAKRTRILRKD